MSRQQPILNATTISRPLRRNLSSRNAGNRLFVVVLLAVVGINHYLVAAATKAPQLPSLSSSCSETKELAKVPRGGSGFPFLGGKSASRKYRETLESQVKILDKQLRQAQDELSSLRKSLKATQTSKFEKQSKYYNLSGTTTTTEEEETEESGTKLTQQQIAERKSQLETERQLNKALKKQIEGLLQHIDQLETMKEELQNMLNANTKKVQDLEEQLKAAKASNEDLQGQFQLQIQLLQKELELKAQKQMDELKVLMEQRIEEAARQARDTALLDLDKKVQEATRKVQKKAERDLRESQRKAEEAVEKERVKMRKLVKAIYLREKQLNKIAEAKQLKDNEDSMESNKSVHKPPGMTITSTIPSKTVPGSHKIESVRGPMG